MRKIFASMTAVSMAAAVMLAGCGSNSSDKKTTTAASTKATEAATEKKTEAATEKETEKVSSEEASTEKKTEVATTEAKTEKATEKETEAATEKETEAATEAKTEEASSEVASKETEAKADENAKVRVIDIDLTSEQYAFGVDKEQPELLEKTNEFIAKIMEDGTFDEIWNLAPGAEIIYLLRLLFADGEPVMVKSAEYDESKDQLVVATNAGFEPFEYMKGEDYCGIDMEMAALLADYLGKELVIQNMDFDAVCLAVGQQKCDIAMAGLTITDSRKDQVTFTDSYYNASQKLIVAADDTTFDACKTKEDVEAIFKTFDSKTKVGAQNGTTAQFYVEGSEDLDFAGFDMTLVGYKNGSLAVQDLLNGNLDYVIIDAAPAESITAAINSL